MNNNKGQTLVEFVLVMPVFILLIISLIDISNIVIKKQSLQDTLSTVYDMYEDSNTDLINDYIEEKNVKLEYITSTNITTIKLTRDINVISPLMSKILGKTYKIEVSRDYYKK